MVGRKKIAEKLSRLIWLYLPPIMGLFSLAMISRRGGIPISVFVREYKTGMEFASYVGIVSDVGILFWSATTSICIFSWVILRKWEERAHHAAFLFCSGILTFILLIDDFFLLHETADIPEKYLFGGYITALCILLVVFWKVVLSSEFELLFFSLLFFGMAAMVDLNQEKMGEIFGAWRILLEDGSKMLGIVGWFGYFSRECYVAVREVLLPDSDK